LRSLAREEVGEAAGYYGRAIRRLADVLIDESEGWLMNPKDGIGSLDAPTQLVEERVFTLSQDLMCVADGTGQLVSVNPAWGTMLGWSAGELHGMRYLDLIHPDDREATSATHMDVVAGDHLVDFTNRFRKHDGKYVWILWSASVDPATGLTYWVGKDVTEREHFRMETVEHSDDAILTKDVDRMITGWNPGAERMYGYTAQEAIGQPIAMLIPLERDDEEDAIFRRVLAGERVDHFETVRVHKDGRKLDISVSVSAIHDLSGRLIGASSIARNVTDARSIVRAQDQVIKRLLLATEFRDDATGQHIVRMSGLCGRIALAMGWDSDGAAELEVAATMHDVGKIAIPDSILLKRGLLTEEERAVMETHAAVGHRMLSGSGIALIDRAAEVALTHHEHIDGDGYPNGLIGEAIPISGRIAAVADVYDALTDDRVYRPAFTQHQALEMMREGSGTHFDPAVLEALLAVLDAERRTGPLTAPQPGAAIGRNRVAADRDHAATQRDQAASDRNRAQANHDLRSAGRQQAEADRALAASSRDQSEADAQLRSADRDKAAAGRDHAAADSDQTEPDRHLSRVEAGQRSFDRDQAADDRERGAVDRHDAAADRAAAANDRQQARADLRRSQVDALTGALGRELGMVTLEREINRARHGNGRLVFAYIDADSLKRVNDTNGHATGDALLRDIVGAIALHLRSYDPIVRLGGDEFVCALSDTVPEDARRRFSEVASAIEQAHPGSSFSVGLAALLPEDSVEQLIHRADTDLYTTRARRKGRR
jgi:PAS domain S-box-containing protein/diguanylate cyclase (GGDEF)-like protein